MMLDTLFLSVLTRSQYDNIDSLGHRDTGTGRLKTECYVSNGK